MRAVIALLLMGTAVQAADEHCLIEGQFCTELRELLLDQAPDVTVAELREPVGAILSASFFPNGPEMVCKPVAKLDDFLDGREFDLVRTEFSWSAEITPPLVECRAADGEIYCHFDTGQT